jgi:hypothetical protein
VLLLSCHVVVWLQSQSLFDSLLDRSAELRGQMPSATAISLQAALDGLWARVKAGLDTDALHNTPSSQQQQQQQQQGAEGREGSAAGGSQASSGQTAAAAAAGGGAEQPQQQRQQQQQGRPPSGKGGQQPGAGRGGQQRKRQRLADTYTPEQGVHLLINW